MSSSRRILSIQSHVVCGYVGNKAAVFPLQVRGYDVDVVNSVQLSNHTGYEHIKGQVLEAADLQCLMDGLHLNSIDSYSHLLTGYVGSKSFLNTIAKAVVDLKSVNSQLVYVCDPVMGDNGKMYVPEDLLEVYKDTIVPLADVIVPNQYEAELLTGIKIDSTKTLSKAVDCLHAMGPRIVVISSCSFVESGFLSVYGSQVLSDGGKELWQLDIPRLPADFTGSGDLFAASILSWLGDFNGDLGKTLESSVATLQHVLTRTLNFSRTLTHGQRAFNIELRLIQSMQDLIKPNVTVTAKKVVSFQ